MLNFGISPIKTAALYDKMTKYQLFEKDIIETFIHSGGKGGQHVNKVATCVRLKHNPSGMEVKCQKARNQLLNRYLARCILVTKTENNILGKKSATKQKIEKIRRQKRKRSIRAKNKMLDNKTHQAQKKENRKNHEL
jgi:peptide chain release factor